MSEETKSGREVLSYEKVDFPSMVKSVNGDFLTLDDVRRLSELLIRRLHLRKTPLQHVKETIPGAKGEENDFGFHSFPNRNSPAFLMAQQARQEGHPALAEMILSQEKHCRDNASMFFMQTPGLHTYNQDADDFLAAPPHFYYYLRSKWLKFRERLQTPEKMRTPHFSGATENLPTTTGRKVFFYHIMLSATILGAYVYVADACARATPGEAVALRCLRAESFTSDHVPNLLVTSLPVFFAVFFVSTAFGHFRKVWSSTYRFGEELSEILTQFLLMSAIEVNLFKAKVKNHDRKRETNENSVPAAVAPTGPQRQHQQATRRADDVSVQVGGAVDTRTARASNSDEDTEEQIVIPAAIVGNALDLARFSGLLAIFLYHSLNPITYNMEAFVPFMIERYGIGEYGLMDALDWNRWIQPQIVMHQKHKMLWKSHAFQGTMSQLTETQRWGSAITQWASEGLLDVLMRGRHLQHTNDAPIVSFNIKTWQDLVAQKNELVAEQAKLLPRTLYNIMWVAIWILYVFQFIKQSSACGNALARTGAIPIETSIPRTHYIFYEGVSGHEARIIDSAQAFFSGFAFMAMFNFFIVIVRMVLDLLDPVAADADSVPILPMLDTTMQRLFSRIILRTVTVMVRQEAFEEKQRRRKRAGKGEGEVLHRSGADMFSSPGAALQLRPDANERVRNLKSLQDLSDAQVRSPSCGWSMRTFDGLPAPFPTLSQCDERTRNWVRHLLGANAPSDDETGYPRRGLERFNVPEAEADPTKTPHSDSNADPRPARIRMNAKAEGDADGLDDISCGSVGQDEDHTVEEEMQNLDQ